jgi:hypothetical protein
MVKECVRCGRMDEQEIKKFEMFLREIKIEVTGPAEVYQQLADAIYDTVEAVVSCIADDLSLKIFECDEEPDSINYARGVGFSWTRTTYCFGEVEGYHIIIQIVEGYNGGEGRVKLESIELIKGDVNER